jgi:hypothetical protein
MPSRYFALAISAMLIIFSSCKSASNESKTTDTEVRSLPLLGVSCTSSSSYRLETGSQISWRMGKLVQGSPDLILVDGSMSVDGVWSFDSASVVGSRAEFLFDVSSVKSDAALRDERIKTFVLLAPKGLPVRLRIDAFDAKAEQLKEGDSHDVFAFGNLSIAGQESNRMKLPLHVEKKNGKILVATREAIKVNLRSDERINGINLSERVAELLAQVPGVSLYDSTEISLKLVFKPYDCNAGH